MKHVKVVHNNFIYIDIGNSNIKFLLNDVLYTYNVVKTKLLILDFLKKHFFLVIVSTNQKFSKWILKLFKKYKNNIYIFNKNDILKYLNIDSKININQIGNDILLSTWYFKTVNIKNVINISIGSYTYSLNIKDGKLIHIDLFLGYKHIYDFFINDKIPLDDEKKYQINTKFCINSLFEKFICFLFKFNKNIYNIENASFNLDQFIYSNNFNLYKKESISLYNNLCLKGLKYFWLFLLKDNNG